MIPTYSIESLRGTKYIVCLKCFKPSGNALDVENLYCGQCKTFHERADEVNDKETFLFRHLFKHAVQTVHEFIAANPAIADEDDLKIVLKKYVDYQIKELPTWIGHIDAVDKFLDTIGKAVDDLIAKRQKPEAKTETPPAPKDDKAVTPHEA